jgi:hypothetical protein
MNSRIPFLRQTLENLNPRARLPFRPPLGDEGGGHPGLGQNVLPAHDSLLNGAACGAHRHDLAQHDQVVVQLRRRAIFDLDLGDDIDALPALNRGALVDARGASMSERARSMNFR